MKTILCGVMATVLAFSMGAAMAEEAEVKPEGAGMKMDAPAAEAAMATPDISLADLKKAIADKAVVVLDCNGTKTYSKMHIPGALDFEAVKADLAKVLPVDKGALVVAYCGGPKCLAYKEGTDAVMKLGHTNVKHFSGGISGWKEAGEACEPGLCKKCGQIKGSDACCKMKKAK